MMEHIKVLLLKFVASFFIFWISFDLFFDATFVDIVSFSLLVTIITYVIGDRMLLPRIGKRESVVVDFFLTYIVVWVFGGIVLDSYLLIAWGSIISATLLAGSEVFVHSYILKNVKPIRLEKQRHFSQRFAFEFAEEQDPNPDKNK
ncbi:YndM family protein [Evansella sp. AB-rgal1]|uniref:YndM family protein n=1 Tax=Evansella sp. AB-rgal1 TaxID=3242696 RepID=UPI00359CD7DD